MDVESDGTVPFKDLLDTKPISIEEFRKDFVDSTKTNVRKRLREFYTTLFRNYLEKHPELKENSRLNPENEVVSNMMVSDFITHFMNHFILEEEN